MLWTDAFQTSIIFLTLATVIGLGIKEIGGMDLILERAFDGDRMTLFNVDIDLRTRHTLWSNVIGGYPPWLVVIGGGGW